MTTQIQALTDLLNAHEMHPKAWQDRRIYLNSLGRDITAYIELDEPTQDAAALTGPMGKYAGGALKVYCNQTIRSSAVARAKQVKHDLMQRLAAAMIADGCPADQWQVADDWREVIL